MKAAIGLTLGAMLVGCGGDAELVAIGQHGDAIVNGSPTNGEPATVYIDVGCSGTLVTSRIVLTACHCLQGVGGTVEVFFGSDIDGPGTWINSIDHEVYPGDCIGDGDLAMITLAEAGPATPIPFNDRDLGMHIGEAVRVVGFGVTGENQGGSGLKREGTTVLGDVETGVMLCDPQIESGTCYGDSGGPNFMTFEGKEYVVGTTSYGTTACGSGWDVSARTDAHADWLQAYVDVHDPADCGADGNCAAFCDQPDPDCPCADDGHCTAACADVSLDPDCSGCGVGDSCREDCPALDTDCCAPDDVCHDGCGNLDPDCSGGGTGGGSSGPGGTGAGMPQPPDDDGDGELDAVDDGGLEGVVSCAAAGGREAGPGALFLAWAALALVRVGSRRRPSAR